MKILYFISIIFIIFLSSCTKSDIPISANNVAIQKTIIPPNPKLVWQSDNQIMNSWPAIFYTPHQDDETIGMGASIAEHVRVGRPVYVVLLSNGANSGMLDYLNQYYYHGTATMQDVINARNNEFIAACIKLGVQRIYISNGGSGFDESVSLSVLQTEFQNTINYFANCFPNASHKTVSGNCDSYDTNCDKMPTHQAATNAIHQLYNAGIISDLNLYRVYVYYWAYGTCDRCSSWWKPVTMADKQTRINAITEYKSVDTVNHRYGLAYWDSVSELFDNSINSDYEYVDFIGNDYL